MDETKTAQAYAENMQAFAKVIENVFPNVGFALMLFDTSTKMRASYSYALTN